MPMTLISRQTLTGTAASVTFNNIPQTYQTLKLVVSARSNAGGPGEYQVLSFNGSTASFSARELTGNGSAASSGSYTSGTAARIAGYATGDTATASTFGNAEIEIPNYFGNANKAVSSTGVSENNATVAAQPMIATLWANTPAITSITMIPFVGTSWLANSTFSLYGVS